MKEKFLKPVMEVVTFSAEDVIQTSGCVGDCSWQCLNDVCTSNTDGGKD